ncbi:MAG: hydantoinase/oxoprolinase family protein, partial [Deltaproteobacteria bacterium]|nr:hydantoinase/oxoprolinase family protein [Deltaproteobacteria bacterium]
GYGKTPEEFLGEVDLIIHGTTLATNALLTGKGAKVGIVTTKNFRDVVELRRGFKNIRTSMYNIFVPPYKPLVPRYLRFGVEERTLANGEVATPLNEQEVREAVANMKAAGVEAIAVCFLHSYINGTHEEQASALCRESPDGFYVTTSHEVLPVWREYERFNTTVVSATIGPISARYLNQLEGRLKKRGFHGSLLIVQANGLVQSPQESLRRAVYLLGSGPAAAPSAAVYCGQLAGKDHLISVDIGGTSLDVSMVHRGEIPMTTESWVGMERVAIKMVDVHSAGAGGGSIAWVDSLGLLRVGPQSAGADPGPACYGKGGEDPTVTDADLVLGYIPADYFLGGEIPLNAGMARRSIQNLASRFGMDALQAAQAIYTTVNAFVADSIAEISTKRGHDCRDFALIAGGGAGPIHGPAIAERLGISTVLVPRFAALYSAFGMFAMDIGRDYARSYIRRADQVDLERVNQLYEEMEIEARSAMKALRVPEGELVLSRTADMRYVGQFHEVEVEIPSGALTPEHVTGTVESLHKRHHELYTFSMRFRAVEFITFRLKATARRVSFQLEEIPGGDENPQGALKRRRSCIFDGNAIDTPVYDGERIRAGNVIQGPAILEEKTTTVVVPPSFQCRVDRFKNYLLQKIA